MFTVYKQLVLFLSLVLVNKVTTIKMTWFQMEQDSRGAYKQIVLIFDVLISGMHCRFERQIKLSKERTDEWSASHNAASYRMAAWYLHQSNTMQCEELTKAIIARDPTVVPEYIDVKALSTVSMESESQNKSSACVADKPRGTYTTVTTTSVTHQQWHCFTQSQPLKLHLLLALNWAKCKWKILTDVW